MPSRSALRVLRVGWPRIMTPLWLWCTVNTTTCSAALLNWGRVVKEPNWECKELVAQVALEKKLSNCRTCFYMNRYETSYFMWWFLCSGSFVWHIAFTVCIWTLVYMSIFGYILWILISHFMLWFVSGCYDENTYKQFPIFFWKPEGPLRLLAAFNRTTLAGYLKWSRHRNAWPLDTGNKMQEY